MKKIIPSFIAICIWIISMDVSAQNNTITDTKNTEAIEEMAEMMAHSLRSPVMRTPDQYGMDYEDIFFQATDGVTIEGWFIPAKNSKKLIIFIFNLSLPSLTFHQQSESRPCKVTLSTQVSDSLPIKSTHN